MILLFIFIIILLLRWPSPNHYIQIFVLLHKSLLTPSLTSPHVSSQVLRYCGSSSTELSSSTYTLCSRLPYIERCMTVLLMDCIVPRPTSVSSLICITALLSALMRYPCVSKNSNLLTYFLMLLAVIKRCLTSLTTMRIQ